MSLNPYIFRLPFLGPRLGIIKPALRTGVRLQIQVMADPAFKVPRFSVDDTSKFATSEMLLLPIVLETDNTRQWSLCEPNAWVAFDPVIQELDTYGWSEWWPVWEPASDSHATGVLVVMAYQANVAAVTDAPKISQQDIVNLLLDQYTNVEIMRSYISHDSAQLATDDTVCFAFGSCQYPAGLLDKSLAYQSYERLGARLAASDAKTKPTFLMLLGDQIYSDATAGLLDPVREGDRFEKSYCDFFRAPAVQNVMRQLPTYMALDDHEIEDNWEPRTANNDKGKYWDAGGDAYWRYQRGAKKNSSADNLDWQDLTHSGLSSYPIFMLDSRSRRSYRNTHNLLAVDTLILDSALPNSPQASSFPLQTQVLEEWLLSRPLNQPKFVSSASIFLPRHTVDTHSDALYLDGWDGYPTSLYRLLGYICKNKIQNVIFLSGDEHLSCFTDIELWPKADRNQVVKATSIHTSALYAPMPFANSKPANLLAQETFEFQYDNVTYVCHYKNEFILKGDGFGVVSLAKKDGNSWCLDYEFDGKKGCTAPGIFTRVLS
ncbi:MAG: alkaline phosphatase D family protein [Cytophagales bacterium]|nr:alkaline phosphatase D family protein [Cytophagales bacterium]